MANGSGVSVGGAARGKWRVRWREVDAAGVSVQRTRVVSSKAAAQELAASVLRAIETAGAYVDPRAAAAPKVATLDAVASGWSVARAARGLSPAAVEGGIGHSTRILAAVRAVEGIGADVPVPVSALSRDLVVRVTAHLRAAGRSDGTIAQTIGALVGMWAWASDDPATYPGVPTPPRDTTSLRPRVAPSVAAPPPTLAECDAVIRRVAALGGKARNVALPVAVVGRWTGLRARQILGIEVQDVALPGCTLTVRVGKSAREKAERRTVPISAELRDWLAPYVARAQAEGRTMLFARRSDAAETPQHAVSVPDRTLREAWRAACEAGEARRETWAPSGAGKGRPEHAFRAAFQAALVVAGVRDEVIDALVGHAGGLRGRHYVDAASRMGAMRAAVDGLPPIDWRGEADADADNVVTLRPR